MTSHTAAATVLHKTEVVKVTSLTKAVFGYCEQLLVVLNVYNTYHVVVTFKANSAHTARTSTHRSDLALVKAHRATVSGCEYKLIFSVCLGYEEQLVALVEIYCDLTAASLILVLGKQRLLDNTLAGYHSQIFALAKLIYRDHRSDLFLLVEFKQVDYIRTLCGS